MSKAITSPVAYTFALTRSQLAGIALFVMLLVVIVGFQPLSDGKKTVPYSGDGDVFRQLAYLGIFAFSAVTLRVPQDLRQLFIMPTAAVLLLAWCWVSIIWAVEPSIATRRLALTTILMLNIFLCVEHAGFELTTRVMRIALVIVLAMNYIAVALFPIAIHQSAELTDPNLLGNWRGILTQKNFAGAVCAITILLYIFSHQTKRRWMKYVILLAAAYFLYRTFSKTSMGILAGSLLIGWLYAMFDARHRQILLPIIALTVCLAMLLGQEGIGAIGDAVSRPDALTGRVQIWPMLITYASEHPIQGSGFGSFWNVGDYSPVYAYSRGWVTAITSGHNGYLDLLVQVGIPGLVLALFAFLIAPFWSLLTNTAIDKLQGALAIASLTFCAGHNMTESSIMDRDMIVQVFLMIFVALTYQLVRNARRVAGQPGRGGRTGAV